MNNIFKNKLLCTNIIDFIQTIESSVDAVLLYVANDVNYAITYDFVNENKHILKEYTFYKELNNTYRLTKTIDKSNEYIVHLVKKWFHENKQKINILSKTNATLQMYGLNETYFNDSRKRELNIKYQKVIEWLDGVIVDGEKEYAEKILKIIEKWKRSYEDKIKTAKTTLKEDTFMNFLTEKSDKIIAAIEQLNAKEQEFKLGWQQLEQSEEYKLAQPEARREMVDRLIGKYLGRQ